MLENEKNVDKWQFLQSVILFLLDFSNFSGVKSLVP